MKIFRTKPHQYSLPIHAKQSVTPAVPPTVTPEAMNFMMKLVMENACENIADMIEGLADQDWGSLSADEILFMAARQVREMKDHPLPPSW